MTEIKLMVQFQSTQGVLMIRLVSWYSHQKKYKKLAKNIVVFIKIECKSYKMIEKSIISDNQFQNKFTGKLLPSSLISPREMKD